MHHTPRPLPAPASRPFFRIGRGLCLAILLATGHSLCAFGQGSGYHAVNVVDEFTQRPDKPPGTTFGFNGAFFNTPSIDGGTLVFRNGDYTTIWRTNVDGTGLAKLVDATQAVPGGTGSFTSLTTSNIGGLPRINGGTVVFPGTSEDASMNGVIGLYTVPAMGGTLSRVVDTKTPVPSGDGTDFTSLGDYNAATGSFTISNGKVAFEGRGGGTAGVYLAGTDGSNLAALADGNHPIDPGADFPVENFFTPAIINGTVVFHGTNVFDPSNGNSGLYATTGGFDYRILANYASGLPGNTDASPHTRFDVPPLANNATTLAFVADDSDSSFGGLFTLPVAGGDLTKIVDYTDALAGLDTTNGFSIGGVALDTGAVAFAANDRPSSGPTHYGVFVRKADGTGPITRIIGSGDVLDDGRVVGSVGLTTGGYSGGIIGVQVYYAFGYIDAAYSGLYAMTPGTLAPVVLNAGTVTGTVGTAFSYRILADNFPTSYTASGLPGGLSLNPVAGIIYGTPTAAGTFALTLGAANSAGTSSGTVTLTIAPAGPPTISSFSPASGAVGGTVAIKGTGFVAPLSVIFAGNKAAVHGFTPRRSTPRCPAGPSPAPSRSPPAPAASRRSTNFIVQAAADDHQLQPGERRVGDTVAITGTNFVAPLSVIFGGNVAAVHSFSATQINAMVPAGAVTGADQGQHELRQRLDGVELHRAWPGRRRSAVSARRAARWARRWCIKGTNFVAPMSVIFAGNVAAVHGFTSTQINATVPGGALTGPIKVNTSAGSVSTATSFTVTP